MCVCVHVYMCATLPYVYKQRSVYAFVFARWRIYMPSSIKIKERKMSLTFILVIHVAKVDMLACLYVGMYVCGIMYE